VTQAAQVNQYAIELRLGYSSAVRDLVSVDKAAERFGTSRATVFRYINDGKLKGYRKPKDRKTYIDANELKKLQKYPLVND
jgi:transposase